MMKITRLLVLLLAGGALIACRAADTAESPSIPTVLPAPADVQTSEPVELPNPASVNCEEQGYTLEMRQGQGGAYGVCLFPDGSECEEWAYLREECRPGDSLPEVTAPPVVTATAVAGQETWQRYTNEMPPYTFLYPPQAAIEPGNDPRQAVTIAGPLVEDEHWPMVYIGHAPDRAEFRPPRDADLRQWLIAQGLLGAESAAPPVEGQQEERRIGGETAVHTRFDRGQQSYAYDQYFFAHDGQLYSIVILHTGEREDWDLYNQFLDSFQFLPGAAVEESSRLPAACPQATPGTYLLFDGHTGICFLYPDDFGVFQGEDGSLALYRRSLLNTEAPFVTIHVEAAEGRSLAEVTEQRLTDFAFPGTQAQDAQLGGQPASLLDELPGQDLNRRLVALYEDQIYDLMVARIGDEYGAVGEEAAALFDLLAGSWQFVDRDAQAGLWAGPECPAEEPGTGLLRHDAAGFCVLLPQVYSVDDGLTDAEGRLETAVYQGSPLDAAHARLFITVEDARGRTLEDVTLAYEAEVESGVPDLDLGWSAGLMLDGQWANELSQVPGQDLARVLLLVQNGRFYTLTFIPDDPAAGQAFAEMQALYDLVVETFSFLGS